MTDTRKKASMSQVLADIKALHNEEVHGGTVYK